MDTTDMWHVGKNNQFIFLFLKELISSIRTAKVDKKYAVKKTKDSTEAIYHHCYQNSECPRGLKSLNEQGMGS